MRLLCLLSRQICLVYFITFALSPCIGAGDPSIQNRAASATIAFVENQGQWPEHIRFRGNMPGGVVSVTNEGITYQLLRATGLPGDRRDDRLPIIETAAFSVRLVGSNGSPLMHGEGEVSTRHNYFLGSNPSRWRTDVAGYGSVLIKNVYPGIDLAYYGQDGRIEYDLRVSPGADYTQIKLEYDGIHGVSIGADGALQVGTHWGELRETAPIVYQQLGGQRIPVAGHYILVGDKSIGFELSEDYDPKLSLVIDPVLVYSTYLGGNFESYGEAICVDSAGYAYVTGYTGSTDFPTVEPYQTDTAGLDVFITKLNPEGDGLMYSTYLGGDNIDLGYGIAVDEFGCAFITGHTASSDFPTMNPCQSNQPFGDIFVTKLNPQGDALVYSTYLGGNNEDYGKDVAVDDLGAAWVSGYTASNDFPVMNEIQTDMIDKDGIVLKLAPDGGSLLFSTYLGGDNREEVLGVAVDTSQAAYVTGFTLSSDFPTVTPIYTDLPDGDAFVTKFSTNGGLPVYSTYIGGDMFDSGKDIAVDDAGHAYITGYTGSTDFPVVNSAEYDKGLDDAFVVRLSIIGRSIDYSAYLGGGSYDEGWGIALDKYGAMYVTGLTRSSSFPLRYEFRSTPSSWEAFVTKLVLGTDVMYSSYLGGSAYEWAKDITIAEGRGVFLVGQTESEDFPVINAHQSQKPSLYVAAFVARVSAADFICGDIDNDGEVSIGDVTFIVAYMFKTGPPPCYLNCANVNLIGDIDIADLTYLVNYMFRQGPALNCPM